MIKKYFSMEANETEASIYIFGDICEWEWLESDTSSYTLAKQLQELGGNETIHVHINSYGGEVKEGLAIYNALKQHKGKVITYCDGFACSIASVIFMAGDERVGADTSLLMIHHAWSSCQGNANEMRKTADDLETITGASINAYLSKINISKEELIDMLDAEKWLTSDEALEMGFVTSVVSETSSKVSQSVKKSLVNMVHAQQKEPEPPAEPPQQENPKDEEPEQELKEPEQDPGKTKEEEAAQMWSSFFNAIKGV